MKQNERISSLPAGTSNSVSLPRLDNSQGVSDNPQTMSGLSSVPNGHRFADNIKPREPNSPASAIENRADADSDNGFARLCFVQRCPLGTLESPLIVCGCRTHPVDCPSVTKTRNSMFRRAGKKFSYFVSKNPRIRLYSGTFCRFFSYPEICIYFPCPCGGSFCSASSSDDLCTSL